jgi:ubiquinone/menaquinone biosynthesis C-methylase UbiE
MPTIELTHDERARLDFVLALRRRWADTLYPALPRPAGIDGAPPRSTVASDGGSLERWFGWVERGSQKLLWRAVAEVVREHPESLDQVSGTSRGTLELDPSIALPDWYTDVDIHVQPGGVWSGDDQARVYELGAKLVMLGDNDDYAFHDLFVRTAVPPRSYRRIVDLGCGFAKSTWPLKRAFPAAEVIGVDLSGPCLRLGHRRAESLGIALDLRQRDCRATGLQDASCDLVTATMLIHELPTEALAGMLTEASRMLAPGGVLRILDFHLTGDPVRDRAMREHGARNNEPFMPVLFDTDVAAMATQAGLVEAQWVAFDERGTGRLDGLHWPPRAEWHFPWAVFEAAKPDRELS